MNWEDEAKRIAAAFELELEIREQSALFGPERHFVTADDLKGAPWPKSPLRMVGLVFMSLRHGVKRDNLEAAKGFHCLGIETEPGFFKCELSAHDKLEAMLAYRDRLARASQE